ncbi:MAG: RHS repeat-associated core domain-containing protein [Fimbriimonadaceae bacterium]|nr:RHS repeat-associated core domain-containing protein [Fimbriimonadaceae bacterium]
MKLHETLFGRLIAQVMVYALVQASIPPAWALSLEAPRTLPESPRQQTKPTAFESYAAELASASPDWNKLQRLAQSFPVIEKPAVSRVLVASEMENRKGLLAVNPYVAGSQKWSVNYAGVDLITGNYTTSATDLSFEGGYGIPINVTRTYSSNNPDDGPLGRGWTLSVDIRSTAGGILKGPGSPVRSTPLKMFDRPINEVFNTTTDTIPNPQVVTEGVIAEDASGFQEQIQRDVDGILNAPAWDANVYESEIELDPDSEDEYWVNTSQTMTTPEGTVYVYEKYGEYDDGAKSVFDEDSPPDYTPSNILKIASITDRHGNETTFEYEYPTYPTCTQVRASGTVTEQVLSKVTMPGGRELHFTYITAGSGAGTVNTGHISRIADGTGSEARAVNYTYTDGMYLATATVGVTVGTSTGGLTTTYAYGSAIKPYDEWPNAGVAHGLLRSITDPRGLETKIRYRMGTSRMAPYQSWYGVVSPFAYLVIQPNNIHTWIAPNGFFAGGSTVVDNGTTYNIPVGLDLTQSLTTHFQDRIGNTNASGTLINDGAITLGTLPTTLDNPFTMTMFDIMAMKPSGSTEYEYPGLASWTRSYNLQLMSLTSETRYTYPWQWGDLRAARLLDGGSTQWQRQEVITDTTSNFLGAPLSKTVTEKVTSNGGTLSTVGNPNVVEYAYHGADKYFQQKAVRVKTGSSSWRYSYTDYYSSTDTSSGAAKGMTRYVYDAKYGGITATGTNWRTGTNSVAPTSGQHAAEFKYDSRGRVTEVQKLKTVSGSTYTRVKTTTSYNSDGSPGWGLPYQVKEDEGSGKLNRTTTTTAYDRAGRATNVTDGAGRTFETAYNQRGQVDEVKRTDTSPDTYIVQYYYGTTGGTAENGMVTEVYDCLSGALTNVTYFASDNGTPSLRGQVDNVYNDDGLLWSDYTVYYDYDAAGRRAWASYEFPYHTTNNVTNYSYRDYVRVGSPESPNFAFQTMTLLDDEDATPEEFHYQFDTSGRMSHSVFAQTPSQTSAYPYYPDSANPTADMATHRAHVVYDYHPAGQLAEIRYAWQDIDDDTYDDTYLRKVTYAYDDYKGLRDSATFASGAGGESWGTGRTENYTYDADLDFLTEVDYNDGLSNEVQSWTYDAAGNRSNSGYTYNNLNMMTASPGATYANDMLGNRTDRNPESSGARQYVWDDAGRLLKSADSTKGATYMYRADGMRIKKVTGLQLIWIEDEESASGYYDEEQDANNPTYRYRYDGQLCFEDDYTVAIPGSPPSASVTGNSYALGGRGIDMIRTFSVNVSNFNRSYTGTQFPIYDGHGNMIATLSRNGTGNTIENNRSYDVWGSVRSSSSLNPSAMNGPNNRYCANLGHKQDDESDLIYMRARYYESGTGRFISEDPARDGSNWFGYCGNEPVSKHDPSGRSFQEAYLWATGILELFSYALDNSNAFRHTAMAHVVFFERLLANLPNSLGHASRLLQTDLVKDLRIRTMAAKKAGASNSGYYVQYASFFIGMNASLLLIGWLLGVWGPGDNLYYN